VVAVTIMSYGNIIVAVKCKIQLVEVIVFTEATVVKTTEVAASVASNVATAMSLCVLYFQRAACSTFQTCILNSH